MARITDKDATGGTAPGGGSALQRRVLLLVLPQVIVALAARFWLVHDRDPLRLLRLLREDLHVIAGFAVVAVIGLALAGRSRVLSRCLGAILCLIACGHCLLLVVNVVAVNFLMTPITWQWLFYSDFIGSITPWRTVSVAVSPRRIVAWCLALVFPLLLAALARAVPPLWSALAGRPGRVLALAAAALWLAAASSAPLPERGGTADISGSPVLVFYSTYTRSIDRLIAHTPGDGQVADYALQPARKPTAAPDRTGGRPNVVVVVIESLRRDVLAQELPRLPTLLRLVRQGQWFRRASVIKPYSTRSAFALGFSRFPLFLLNMETATLLDRRLLSWPEALRRAGYATRFMTSEDMAFDDLGAFLARQGFGPADGVDTLPCPRHSVPGTVAEDHYDWLPDSCLFALAAQWATSRRQPWALTLWTGGTHFPYNLEHGHESDPERRYRLALHETDASLATFLARLRAAGLPDPVVIVTGDHGEAFGEHGFNSHPNTIYEEEIGVPLVLSGPGVPPAVREDLAQPVDIGPTVLDLAGAPVPAGWQGQSLLRPLVRRRAFSFAISYDPMIGYREGDVKYLMHLADGTIVRFDLARDPLERKPVPLGGSEAERVRRAVAGWVAYNRGLYPGLGR